MINSDQGEATVMHVVIVANSDAAVVLLDEMNVIRWGGIIPEF